LKQLEDCDTITFI
jgi:hypothetical protein